VIVPPRRRAWEQEAQDWGGGLWRRSIFEREEAWPASWVQFERKKFLLAGAAHIAKFEGLGHFGEQARVRATLLADAGFCPQVEPIGDGYLRYRRLRGRPANRTSPCPALLERMAQYLAWRARGLAVEQVNLSALETMLRCNLEEEFGRPVRAHPIVVERPACVDGRMLAHEWIESPQGWMKVDGVGHGDDHFYPGSADIAWDLGGAIVEWEMNSDAAEYLVGGYVQLTGDQVNARLPGWKLAYATFRMAYCKMAAEALAGTAEASRLSSEYRRYRAQVRRMLPTGLPETVAAPPACVGASQKL
jgi:hypothetical protein